MLLRQHRSIDSLTEVVKTQANTIAGLVSLLGGGGGEAAAAVAAPRGRRVDAAAGRRSSGNSGSCSGSGNGGVDDEDAIAEMVAYLDDDATLAPAAAVVGL